MLIRKYKKTRMIDLVLGDPFHFRRVRDNNVQSKLVSVTITAALLKL